MTHSSNNSYQRSSLDFLALFFSEVLAYLEPDSLVFLEQEFFTDMPLGEKKLLDIVVKARFLQNVLLPPRRVLVQRPSFYCMWKIKLLPSLTLPSACSGTLCAYMRSMVSLCTRLCCFLLISPCVQNPLASRLSFLYLTFTIG